MASTKQTKKSIQIQLKLFATLGKYLPSNADRYDCPSGTTAGDLAKRLNLPIDQVKLIFINGRRQPPDKVLKKNDRVGIFPPVGGG